MLLKNKQHLLLFILTLSVLLIGVFAINHLPELQMKASQVLTWVRVALNPAGQLPTAQVSSAKSVEQSPFWLPDLFTVEPGSPETTVTLAAKQALSALPGSVTLTPPFFDETKDYQDWNNCGPATLALGLRYWGWQGDQFTISQLIRPKRQDKNVNIEELAGYVNTSADGLQAEVRTGGDLSRLEDLIAGGYPVIIEEAFKVEKSAWPGDDLWAGHYLLLTGYDQSTRLFTAQDSYYGPDRLISFADIADNWQAFNHIYLVVFPIGDLPKVQTLLAQDWPVQDNLKRTAAAAQNQVQLKPGNAFAWFNLGSSLTDLQDYASALQAFDKARALGLPQRMLRYQFGPLIAAYQTGDQKDLAQLADYALQITPDSEEALLYKGWAYELAGDHLSAIALFHKALEANPAYMDAENALAIVRP